MRVGDNFRHGGIIAETMAIHEGFGEKLEVQAEYFSEITGKVSRAIAVFDQSAIGYGFGNFFKKERF